MHVDLDFFCKGPAWLEGNTIFLSLYGSHAYGTSTPESDLDLRGCAIPPKEMLLGYLQTFEQHSLNEPDCVIFALNKFIDLCAKGNPNALEVLFTDPSCHIIVTPLGEKLLENRDLFLTQKIRHTFAGYAHAQLGRIERHRKWLVNPPKTPPTRADLGLPERTVIPADQLATAASMIQKKIESWSLDLEPLTPASKIEFQTKLSEYLTELKVSSDDEFRAAGRTIGMSENFLEILAKERAYKSAKDQYDQYLHWKKTRNPVRAAIEEKYGYDCKHGSHLTRLYRSCLDTIRTGTLKVRRDDAEELLAIKNGAWSYDRLMEEAKRLEAEVQQAMTTTPLPYEPDRKAIDRLCVEITECHLNL